MRISSPNEVTDAPVKPYLFRAPNCIWSGLDMLTEWLLRHRRHSENLSGRLWQQHRVAHRVSQPRASCIVIPGEPQRIRTPCGRGTPDGHRGSSRANQPRALPDRPAGNPQPPSGGTFNTGLAERFHPIGYRSPQCRWRQPSTVHRIGVGLGQNPESPLAPRWRHLMTERTRPAPDGFDKEA